MGLIDLYSPSDGFIRQMFDARWKTSNLLQEERTVKEEASCAHGKYIMQEMLGKTNTPMEMYIALVQSKQHIHFFNLFHTHEAIMCMCSCDRTTCVICRWVNHTSVGVRKDWLTSTWVFVYPQFVYLHVCLRKRAECSSTAGSREHS